jgi:hypothetical protein
MNQLTAGTKKHCAWFQIAADDEMLAAAEPLMAFLRAGKASFCATGRGRSSGDQLEYEIAFNSKKNAECARRDWLAYRYLFL